MFNELLNKYFNTLLRFTASLVTMVNVSNFAACIYLSNQSWMTRLTLFDLNPDEDNQGLCYYQFMVDLGRCNGSCNTLDDTSGKTCVPSKTENVNIKVFHMITRINGSKTLTKHLSSKCKYKFDGRKCTSNKRWNNDLFRCKRKNPKINIISTKKIIFGILIHVLV